MKSFPLIEEIYMGKLKIKGITPEIAFRFTFHLHITTFFVNVAIGLDSAGQWGKGVVLKITRSSRNQ